jgi:hypothetical protein
MEHGRNRKPKALAVALVATALAAPAARAFVPTDARHQALVDKTQVQVDAHHQVLLRHRDQVAPFVYVTTRPETAGDGMDWGAAGIGAGAAFGVVILGSAAALVGRKKLVSA